MSTFSNINRHCGCGICNSCCGPNRRPVEQIPGPRGPTGLTPDMSLRVTPLGPFDFPTVSKIGTAEAPVFTLGIPRGIPGKQGERGHPGEPGPQGPGILQIQNQFMTTSVMLQPTVQDAGWQPSLAGIQLDSVNRFLWRWERVILTTAPQPETYSNHIMLIAIVGRDGAPGRDAISLNLFGVFDDEADLRAQHPVGAPGMAALTKDTGFLWVWNSDTNDWVTTGEPFQGPRGEPGTDGESINLLGRFVNLLDLETSHPNPSTTDIAFIGTVLYRFDGANWQLVVDLGGDQGAPGDDGQDGLSITLLGSFVDVSALELAHPTPALGNIAFVGTWLYQWSGTSWAALVDLRGPQGIPGTVDGGVLIPIETAILDLENRVSALETIVVGVSWTPVFP